MKDFATLMSSKAVFFLSQDDKARVPLGIPAVNKQVRMAMHLQYRGRLPHHDWVVAERHKLIPGVYAACAISKEKVPYVGPTYVAIRSGKHDHSSAASHFADFTELVDLESFRDLSRTSTGKLKPILLVTVDGGHDESPRFPKTLRAWASVFMQFDLDYTMVATHAPGQSAYNAVERRMAPVLKELAGVILPYDNSEIFLRFCAKQ